jgi:V8-like Glu-specific endopeptidase
LEPDDSETERLYIPSQDDTGPRNFAPRHAGTSGRLFTTRNIFPDNLAKQYPHSTAGKLFYTDPRDTINPNRVCSGAVIRHRLVVTAGHCVYFAHSDPANRYFYQNFLFVPGYNFGKAPLKRWPWAWVIVSGTWAVGGHAWPNAQDVAILEVSDFVDKRGVVRKLSEYTGFLGYKTLAVSNNNLTMLGYPLNLNSGELMVANQAQTAGDAGNNTYAYGSLMMNGSSGGPWIQDFGQHGKWGQFTLEAGGNLLVSVTSWGPTEPGPYWFAGSQLDSRFLSLLETACAHRIDNCPAPGK